MIKTKNTFSFLYHWHQRIGLFMSIAVIAWALSGLAHPIISRLNPKPAAPPPVEVLNTQQLGDFSALIEQQNIQTIEQLRLFQWQGEAVYRIASERGVAYFSAQTLQPLDLGDFDYAEYLARHFLGDKEAALGNLQLINEFNKEYLYINRYLPVVRVDFAREDEPRLYIDATQGRLATIDNKRKVFTGKFFRALHSWTWIESLTLRRSLMSVFLVLGFATALFGLVVYIKSWRMGIFKKNLSAHQHHPRTRRLHRSLGAVVALFAMAFCASGLLHLWLTDKTDAAQKQITLAIPAQGLTLPTHAIAQALQNTAIADIQLAQIDNTIYWRVKKQPGKSAHAAEHEHHHHGAAVPAQTDAVIYVNARTGAVLDKGWEKHAQSLALTFSELTGDQVARIELVETFGGEYGFVNKRLPVHGVHFDLPGNPVFYIETASNTLASQVNNTKRVEGFSFAYLHKWHFADALGKDLRDILTSVTALLIMLVILLGVYRYITGRHKRHIRG